MDPFASRVSHQLPQNMSWKIDLFSQGRDAFQISWVHKFVYTVPYFVLIGRVLQKVNQDQCLIITPAWPGLTIVFRASKNLCKKSITSTST